MTFANPEYVVITYGTFDLFHFGHVELLRRARGLGTKLIVGCSTDSFNIRKGKRAVIPYEHRKHVLLSCRFVDEVFPEDSWDQKEEDIAKYNAKVFVMGDDWHGAFDSLKRLVQVVYLPRTINVSSSEIRRNLHEAS
jgi:glycerol-3-phosphate cytidylyltransferase